MMLISVRFVISPDDGIRPSRLAVIQKGSRLSVAAKVELEIEISSGDWAEEERLKDKRKARRRRRVMWLEEFKCLKGLNV